jgi:hypothetical protein
MSSVVATAKARISESLNHDGRRVSEARDSTCRTSSTLGAPENVMHSRSGNLGAIVGGAGGWLAVAGGR